MRASGRGDSQALSFQGQAKFTSSINHSLDFWEACQLGCLPGSTSLAGRNPGLSTDLSKSSTHSSKQQQRPGYPQAPQQSGWEQDQGPCPPLTSVRVSWVLR